MPRIVLLGLGTEDVDVLSRLSHLDPRPEVLAVHPDPEALILRLAAVASYPALTEPPRPREDDIVVVPSMRGPLDAQMVRPWREAGARILLPDAPALADLVVREREAPVLTGARGAGGEVRAAGATGGPAPGGPGDPSSKRSEGGSPTVVATSDSEGAPRGGSRPEDGSPHVAPPPAAQPPRPSGRVPEEPSAPVPPAPSAADREPSAPVSPAPSAPGRSPAAPPASVWDSPEETFRHLAGETFGAGGAVSLWWDGGAGVWVPWIWTGPAPAREARPPENGIELASRWGPFRLGVPSAATADVPVAAFTRVAEDLALRDLATWREEARNFAGRGLPAADADAEALRRWVEPVLSHLGASSVLVWKRDGDRYRLLHAAGEGLELSGSLVMPAAMVAAAFETEAAGWRRWDAGPALCLHFGPEGDDPRRPLRLRRLERALAGEDAR